MSNTDILFQPFKLKSLELPNRIVMAPMTRTKAENGIPGAINAEYYRKRAEGGVGLILSEGTVVNRRHRAMIRAFRSSMAMMPLLAGPMLPRPCMGRVVKWARKSGIPDQPAPLPNGNQKPRSKARPAFLARMSRAATP